MLEHIGLCLLKQRFEGACQLQDAGLMRRYGVQLAKVVRVELAEEPVHLAHVLAKLSEWTAQAGLSFERRDAAGRVHPSHFIDANDHGRGLVGTSLTVFVDVHIACKGADYRSDVLHKDKLIAV